MNKLIAIILTSTIAASTALAQPAATPAPEPLSDPSDDVAPPATDLDPAPATTGFAAPTPPADLQQQVDAENAGEREQTGWRRPTGKRLMHGFRLGYNVIMNYDRPTRDNGMSLKDEFGLKTPHSMLLGYEAFYRIVGHSWLNVLMVANVTVAGLEQSKFIPAASGLIGFELDQAFQLGVGVNLTPDPQSPAHMIVAAGWTPRVGAIHTPVHVYFIPDTETNHRAGVTLGVTW